MAPFAKALRILGLGIISVGVIAWLVLGANTGWTKTYLEVAKVDEVTGIEYPEKVQKFVPGIDLLIPLCGAGLACLAGSFFFRRRER